LGKLKFSGHTIPTLLCCIPVCIPTIVKIPAGNPRCESSQPGAFRQAAARMSPGQPNNQAVEAVEPAAVNVEYKLLLECKLLNEVAWNAPFIPGRCMPVKALGRNGFGCLDRSGHAMAHKMDIPGSQSVTNLRYRCKFIRQIIIEAGCHTAAGRE
jgi:hypothetical protein